MNTSTVNLSSTAKKLNLADFKSLVAAQFGMYRDEEEYNKDWRKELNDEAEAKLNALYAKDIP